MLGDPRGRCPAEGGRADLVREATDGADSAAAKAGGKWRVDKDKIVQWMAGGELADENDRGAR